MATDLDRLFREKLDQIETAPAAASWQQVQRQITPKKAYWIMPRAIAAAVAILVVASWIIWNDLSPKTKKSQQLSEINHPVIGEEILVIEIPERINSQKIKTSMASVVQPQKVIEKGLKPSISLKPFRSIAMLDRNLQTELPIDITLRMDNMAPEHGETIKITYVASNQLSDEASSGRIGNFLSYLSREAAPTEILADIRDAKNQLLSRN